MKTGLHKGPRLTDKEEKVIQSAFNLADSIVAGDYHLPNPMCRAINEIQDAVHELANERGISIAEGCSEEYLGYSKGYWACVEDRLKGRTE